MWSGDRGTGAGRTMGFCTWMKRKPWMIRRGHWRHHDDVDSELACIEVPVLGSKSGASSEDLGVIAQEVEVDLIWVNEICQKRKIWKQKATESRFLETTWIEEERGLPSKEAGETAAGGWQLCQFLRGATRETRFQKKGTWPWGPRFEGGQGGTGSPGVGVNLRKERDTYFPKTGGEEKWCVHCIGMYWTRVYIEHHCTCMYWTQTVLDTGDTTVQSRFLLSCSLGSSCGEGEEKVQKKMSSREWKLRNWALSPGNLV